MVHVAVYWTGRVDPRLLPTRLAWCTPRFTRFRFIDGQCTSGKLRPLESLNSRFGFTAIRHLNKAETARASGFTVRNDLSLFNDSILFKKLAQVIVRGGEGKIANIDVHVGFLMELRLRQSPEYPHSTQEQYRGVTAKHGKKPTIHNLQC